MRKGPKTGQSHLNLMNGTCGIEAQPRWGWLGWRILTQGSPDLRRDNPGLEDKAPLGPFLGYLDAIALGPKRPSP